MARAGSALPRISSPLPPDLRQFVERVTEYIESGGGVTRTELAAAGVITVDGTGRMLAGDQEASSRIPPPEPTNVTTAGALTHILIEWDTPAYGNHAYTEVWASGTNDIGAAVLVGTSLATMYPHEVGTGQTRYYWVRFVSAADIAGPWNALSGTPGQTADDPAWMLAALAGQISEDQLVTALNARIDLIDGPDSLVGSVAQRVRDEAVARRDAVLLEARQRIADTQANAEATLRALLAVDATQADLRTGIAQARFELREEVSAGLSAEATARLNLKALLDAEDSLLAAAVSSEQSARVAGDAAEASARDVLAAQMRGTYEGADLASVTTGLLYQEREARVSQDAALSQQITLLSAGAGEQFDWQTIWYFDTGAESWTGNGTPTAAAGWLRPADHGSEAYVESPIGIAAVGATYSQVRLRIRKTGSPTFAGYIWWRASTDSTWDAARRTALSEPTYDANGIGLITVSPGWSAVTVDRVRLDLSAVQTATDYFEIDWVAIGRPSPGASSAQVYELQLATIDEANASSLAYQLNALEATVNDPSTGLAAVATVADAARTESEVNSALASRETVIAARYGGGASRVFWQAAAPAQADETVGTATGSTTVKKLHTGDIWYDTDDGNKPHVWQTTDTPSAGDGQWNYTPDASAAAAAAFLSSTESALAGGTSAQIQATRDAVAEVTDPSTGLTATRALAQTASDSIADVDHARATDSRMVIAQQDDLSEALLRALVSGESTRNMLASATALARQELRAEVASGLSAEASARLSLAALVDTNSAAIIVEQSARADGDSANASNIATLQTTVGGHTTSIQSMQTSIDGIHGAIWFKIDIDGNVSGYGLASDLIDGGGVTSRFIASVDQYAIVAPASSVPAWVTATAYAAGTIVGITGNAALMLVCKVAGTSGGSEPSLAGKSIGDLIADGTATWQVASRVPFYVLTTSQVINGVSCTPGVYVDGAMIVNGTVQNAQIGDAAVDDAKVANVSASKITTGTLAADEEIRVGANDEIVLGSPGGEPSIVATAADGSKQARLTAGDMAFYRNFGSGLRLNRYLTGVERHVANDGSNILTDAYYSSTPTVMLSPASLQSFNPAYASQIQTIQLTATPQGAVDSDASLWAAATAYEVHDGVVVEPTSDLMLICAVAGTSGGSAPIMTGVVAGDSVIDNTVTWTAVSRQWRRYEFAISAKLVVTDPGVTDTWVNTQTGATDSYTTTTASTGPNATGISVNVTVFSEYPGTANFTRRQVTVTLYYRIYGTSDAYATVTRLVQMGNQNYTGFDIEMEVSGLAPNAYQYYVGFVAANDAAAPGTFGSTLNYDSSDGYYYFEPETLSRATGNEASMTFEMPTLHTAEQCWKIVYTSGQVVMMGVGYDDTSNGSAVSATWYFKWNAYGLTSNLATQAFSVNYNSALPPGSVATSSWSKTAASSVSAYGYGSAQTEVGYADGTCRLYFALVSTTASATSTGGLAPVASPFTFTPSGMGGALYTQYATLTATYYYRTHQPTHPVTGATRKHSASTKYNHFKTNSRSYTYGAAVVDLAGDINCLIVGE